MADEREQFKNYRVGEVIGRGRFAVVYKAEKLDVRKTVALKVLNPEFASRVDVREQFREQAKHQARLNHPRLVRVEDLREEHGQFFVAMEYMPLGSLASWVTQNGMPSFQQTAVIIADIAEVLDYLHGQGLVHGDIKPSNILLMNDPNQKDVLRAKLSDLRLPMKMEVLQTVSENLIELTPEYISPEQAREAPITPLSDQYVLGVVAYELLCGQPPFAGKSRVDLYIDHQKNRPPSLQQLNSLVTSELELVVLRALEKSPENRYPSCSEFARALRAAAAATEKKRLDTLLTSAAQLLEKQDFSQARFALLGALLIEPENEKAAQISAQLERQEGLSKNYQQALDSLQLADARAHEIRKDAPNDPDDAGLLKTFAPPPPPFWKQFIQRWRPASFLAGLLLFTSLVCITGITTWIEAGPGKAIKVNLVATVRTSTQTASLTPTFTLTPTITLTPTVTPSLTPTITPTYTSTPTPIGGATGKIAFASNRNGTSEIYLMNADGSNPQPLTNNSSGTYSDLAWSQDGQKLAFILTFNQKYDYFVFDLKSNKLINLTKSSAPILSRFDISAPSWSPDGKKITFVSTSLGWFDVYTIDADGSNPVAIRLTINQNYDGHPAWSPSGNKIAFESDRSIITKIFVMNPDGSSGDSPLKLSANFGGKDTNPVWTPNGQRIIFVTNRDNNNEIYAMNADGSDKPTNLTNNKADDRNPHISPNGDKIVFVSDRDGNNEIYVMNSDGNGEPLNLSIDPGNDYNPAWSPDGKKITFVSNRDGDPEIFSVNVDGTDLTSLTKNNSANDFPVWMP